MPYHPWRRYQRSINSAPCLVHSHLHGFPQQGVTLEKPLPLVWEMLALHLLSWASFLHHLWILFENVTDGRIFECSLSAIFFWKDALHCPFLEQEKRKYQMQINLQVGQRLTLLHNGYTWLIISTIFCHNTIIIRMKQNLQPTTKEDYKSTAKITKWQYK